MRVYLNAANEVAVARFLRNELAFNGIASVVEQVLERLAPAPVSSIEEIVAADKMARESAESAANEFVRSNRRVAGGLAQ
jgi:1-deoxy-D-xylulose-5-phosphate reductoisomerase